MRVFVGTTVGAGMTNLLLCLALVAPLATAQERPEYVDRVVVVQFAPDVSIANKAARTGLQEFDRRAARYDVHLIERVYPFLDHVEPTPKTRRNLMALRRTYFARYNASVAPEQVSDDLASAAGVVYAEPVLVNRIQALDVQGPADPNDPRYGEQTYLRHLRLPEAWNTVRSEDGAPRVVIAIVDGGGEWRHEDLRANVWTNSDEIVGNGVDDDDNGFIDDVHGVNFANRDETNNDPTGLPQTPSNARHGTASAGAASAVTNNSVGISGAAWNAHIMHVNAGCNTSDTRICYGYRGIMYAAANGADIINASWGSLADTDTRVRFRNESLDLATDMGALVVASADNETANNDVMRYYPARHPRVLSVGATERDSRKLAFFSNYGKLVNVFAPGVSILTTGVDNEYVQLSGTSFSSPLTAGVAALVKARFPRMAPDAIREQVRLASESLDAENPALAGRLGRGFVNALAAIQEPEVPAVRVQSWLWSDRDGDKRIESGDVVRMSVTVVNHLVDARRLQVRLRGAEPYPFIDMTRPEVDVGRLASGASARIAFEFRVLFSAPENSWVRFFLRAEEGAFVDEADMFSLNINRSPAAVHRSLRAFYTATGGDDWTRNDNWNLTTVPSERELATWYGAELTDGWLVGLRLPANNLAGMLPSQLGDLAQLRQLRLWDNSLTGPIPPELGNLTRLQWLSLGGNTLTGPIPPELGNLRHLQALELPSNSLTGVIPSGLGNLTELRHLRLDGNSIVGPIPSELGNLTQLRWMSLSDNSLTGVLPSGLSNLRRLQQLQAWGNSISGPIPSEFGNLTQLQWLNLADNSLAGAIPSQLGNLTQLYGLVLADNSLTGAIPSEFGNLTQMQWLNLSGNSLTGVIPSELGNLTQMQVLRLSDNSLTGVIPSGLGNLGQLDELNLDGNSLTGAIPSELGNLTRLYELYLDGNSLTGTIPSELGNLTRLQRLDLADNRLTGTLPRSFMQLSRLWSLIFDGQALCAPADDAFQEWLGGIPNVRGPTCEALQFASDVKNRIFTANRHVASLVLPEATGGAAPYTYALEPALPSGLGLDDSLRTISGIPTAVTPATRYSYSVTDNVGTYKSLTFSLEVVPAVSFGT